MTLEQLAALVYGAATVIVVGFQVALALGAPWGAYALGGKISGRWPARMRAAAIGPAVILTALAAIVLSRAGVALPGLAAGAPWLIWVVVAISAGALVVNVTTPGRKHWALVVLVMLASSLVVALRS